MVSVDRILVEQRMRNRIIEMLEIASSFDAIAELGMFEAVNCWDDFVLPDRKDYHQEPAYSPAEQTALWEIHEKWGRAADAIVNDSWDSAEISKYPNGSSSKKLRLKPWQYLIGEGVFPKMPSKKRRLLG